MHNLKNFFIPDNTSADRPWTAGYGVARQLTKQGMEPNDRVAEALLYNEPTREVGQHNISVFPCTNFGRKNFGKIADRLSHHIAYGLEERVRNTLNEAVKELCTNAVHHSESTHAIAAAVRTNNRVTFSVGDAGVGLAKKFEKVFDNREAYINDNAWTRNSNRDHHALNWALLAYVGTGQGARNNNAGHGFYMLQRISEVVTVVSGGMVHSGDFGKPLDERRFAIHDESRLQKGVICECTLKIRGLHARFDKAVEQLTDDRGALREKVQSWLRNEGYLDQFISEFMY